MLSVIIWCSSYALVLTDTRWRQICCGFSSVSLSLFMFTPPLDVWGANHVPIMPPSTCSFCWPSSINCFTVWLGVYMSFFKASSFLPSYHPILISCTSKYLLWLIDTCALIVDWPAIYISPCVHSHGYTYIFTFCDLFWLYACRPVFVLHILCLFTMHLSPIHAYVVLVIIVPHKLISLILLLLLHISFMFPSFMSIVITACKLIFFIVLPLTRSFPLRTYGRMIMINN